MNTVLSAASLAEVEAKCLALRAALEGKVTWQADDRYAAVVGAFSVARLDEMLRILIAHLGWARAPEDLLAAPAPIRAVAAALGGLAKGQILFTFTPPGAPRGTPRGTPPASPSEGPILYGAWWPWGDGLRISIRLGLFAPGADPEENAAFAARLGEWFGL